jgi:hypothetical protein
LSAPITNGKRIKMATNKIKTIEMSWDNFESIVATWLYAVRALPEGKDIEILSLYPDYTKSKIEMSYRLAAPEQLEIPF